jgi:hypothetical protein
MYPAGVCESFPSEQWGMAVLPASQTESVEGRNMIIYSSQIYLRVLLNEAHNMLYGAGMSSQRSNKTRNVDQIYRWQQKLRQNRRQGSCRPHASPHPATSRMEGHASRLSSVERQQHPVIRSQHCSHSCQVLWRSLHDVATLLADRSRPRVATFSSELPSRFTPNRALVSSQLASCEWRIVQHFGEGRSDGRVIERPERHDQPCLLVYQQRCPKYYRIRSCWRSRGQPLRGVQEHASTSADCYQHLRNCSCSIW